MINNNIIRCTAKRGRPSLQGNDVDRVIKRRPPSNPTPNRAMRLDKVNHFPEFMDKQSRCRNCKTGYTHIKCIKCKVSLCLIKNRNCFANFHGVAIDNE